MIDHTSNLIDAINNFLTSKFSYAATTVAAGYVWVSPTAPPHGFDWDFFFKALAAVWIAIQIFKALRDLSKYLREKYDKRKRATKTTQKDHW